MTALREFQRLEAAGLWRASDIEQRRDVIISLGDASLTITDMRDRPLAHWSIAALTRANPGQFPALFHPDGDPQETLEIAEDETTMLAAIDKLQNALSRTRPHPGRLRRLGFGLVAVLLAVVIFVALPRALYHETLSAIPEVQHKTIGQAILARVERVSGQLCTSPEGNQVLRRFARRLGAEQVVILRNSAIKSQSLPGGIVLLNRSFVEDFEDPAVAAGAVLTEELRQQSRDPLADLLDHGGLATTFRLLTTGEIRQSTLDSFVEESLPAPRPEVDQQALLAAFADVGLSSRAYAFGMDVTGETTLALIEADPMAGQTITPVLRDRDWVILQGICG